MGELDLQQFNIEQFDFDQVFQDLQRELKKPNILICGGTGVGKSSLVNDIFYLYGEDMAKVGVDWNPETMGVQRFTSDDCSVNLYDTQGYEIGADDNKEYLEDIIGFIDQRRLDHPMEIAEHIHEVWYCISAGNKRFFDMDKDLIREIERLQVPIMLLITKVDEVSADELADLKQAIRDAYPNLDVFTYSTAIPKESAIYKTYVQKEEITNWAIEHLDTSLLSGLLPALSGAIDAKAAYARKVVIPKYTSMAVGTVAATSFLPVSIVDSIPLMGIQVKMAMEIFSLLGISYDIKSTASSVAGTTLASYVGRTLSSKIIGMIPYINKVSKFVEAGVNMTVAGSVTATLGMALQSMGTTYAKACIENGGQINFAEYFSVDAMKQAVDYVTDHMMDFGIEDIVNMAVQKSRV